MEDKLVLYVINLDRSPERLVSATAQLDALGLRWERISAVDGATMPDDIVSDRDLQLFSENVGRPVRRSEIALYASHVKAMETLLASPYSYCVIFEDDFGIDDPALFKNILNDLLRVPDLWDIVKLSGVHRHPLPVPQIRLAGNAILGAPILKTTGAHGYLVNREGAAATVKGLRPWQDHFDHRLDHPWRFGVKYRIVWPFPVRERPFDHTIDYGARKSRFSLWQRRKPLWYRMKVGLMRVWYNARHGWFLKSSVYWPGGAVDRARSRQHRDAAR